MRTVTKNITLLVGENTMDFRLTKLDAFSGARLLKLLSHASTDNLQELLLSLPEEELETLMKTCLHAAYIILPAGPIPAYNQGSWGIPDLEYDAWTCLKLTMEVIEWTLEGFFPGSASDT